MPQQITIRLDDAVYSRLMNAAKARGIDVSSIVRQAIIAYLEGRKGTAPTAVPPHYNAVAPRVTLRQS